MTRSAGHSTLPPLSEDEALHSAAAAALIREQVIAGGGWLKFSRFMELALYAPGIGYYSAGSLKIGAGGDFVTAPETSDLFSVCVAHQCAEVLTATGGEILELGAGTGRMACRVLQALDDLGVLPDRYSILEVSADLAARQKDRVRLLPKPLRDRVVWLSRLPDRPVRGVMLANEVLDALPCDRFVIQAGAAHELGVALEGGSFVWRAAPAEFTPAQALLHPLDATLPDGYISEICANVEPWVAGVGACLDQGTLLVFDYGLPRAHYYHPQRVEGTLRCHFKQRAHDDPFRNIAAQDITAWVDFTRVAEAAVAGGLEVAGFVTQAAFLLGTGIEKLASAGADVATQVRLAGEARRLLLPGEMGEAFKVMALSRNLSTGLCGFTYQDLRASL
jgi:SAM-dependent MidA family methyltransferase